MAGMVIDWHENPRYGRLIQKIRAMGPDQRAIFNTGAVDEAFASDAMMRNINALAMAADKKARGRSLELGERRLGLSKKAFDVKEGLTREGLDLSKKDRRWGTYLAAANIPISGYMGYKQMTEDFDEAEETKKYRQRLLEILQGGKK